MLSTGNARNHCAAQHNTGRSFLLLIIASCILLIMNFIFLFCNGLRLSTYNKEDDNDDINIQFHSLYCTRSGTSSHCSLVCSRCDRPRSYLCVSLTLQAVAFSYSLKLVHDGLGCPSENGVSVVHAWLSVEWTLGLFELVKPLEACCTDSGNVLVKTGPTSVSHQEHGHGHSPRWF